MTASDFPALIRKRRSIRKYQMDGLMEADLQAVASILADVRPLNAHAYETKVVSHEDFFLATGGFFRIDAPHYLVMYGDGTDEGLMNIGFIGEQICLALAGIDIGTVFLGGASPKDRKQKETYAIAIGFGRPGEPFRTSPLEAKRKKLEEITEGNISYFLTDLENARLAPSAMNRQPWYFLCQDKEIDVYMSKNRLLSSLKKLRFIDMGIVLSHFLDKDITFRRGNAKDLKGRSYLCTIRY